MNAQTARNGRRGAVGLSMIIVMVVLQLAVVGAVVTGARDLDGVVQRADASRAFFAAEGATNMAVRELMNGTDEDGDGAIGTISNDGNTANDPLFGTARVYVSATTVSGQTTLTARGRSGACRRSVATVSEAGGGGGGGSGTGNTTTMCVFAQNGQSTARYSIYSAGVWGPKTAMPSSIGGEATFVMCRPSSVRNEIVMVTLDDQKDVNLVRFNGTAWSAVTELCTDTDEKNYRAVDVAYEGLSGNALTVYWSEASGRYAYRTWNGSVVSGESLLPAISGANNARWVTLYPRPGTNDIILLAQYKTGSKALGACVWSGGTWGAWTTMTTDLESDTTECYALEFEGLSNTAVAVYAEGGEKQPRYRTWNGSAWSVQGTMASMGGAARWVRLAADPASDVILLVALDKNDDLEANRWDGSAWGSNTQFESNTGGHSSRRLDLCYERGTSRALLVYREKKKDAPLYRVWDGAAWGSETSGPDINRKLERIQLAPGAVTGEVFLACSDDKDDLHLFRWNGSSLSSDTLIETNLGQSGAGTEPMSLVASFNAATRPRITSWTEAAPQ